jgi:hypothetical protein
MKKIIVFLLLITAFYSCKSKSETNTKTASDSSAAEWINLLDNAHIKGWRAYKGKELPPGWIVRDGVLTFDTELGLEQNYKGGKDIIYGAEEFDNFELYIEWKIPEGGNSGIFYHVKEQGYKSPTEMAPEYQLIDDVNYARIHDLTGYNKSVGVTKNPEKLQTWQQTGADYAMYPADPAKKLLNPVGEWNSTRIIFTPEKVEYWLNGKKTVSFVPWSEDWYKRKNSGKWKNSPDYGKYKSGYIGLQDHSSPIWFRNIKIKKL